MKVEECWEAQGSLAKWAESLSGILCARHSMTTRSMYADE